MMHNGHLCQCLEKGGEVGEKEVPQVIPWHRDSGGGELSITIAALSLEGRLPRPVL